MEKIKYRLVFDRKHTAERKGKALVQLEARHNGRKAYFSTGVYVQPSCFDREKGEVVGRPDGEDLNVFLYDFMLRVQQAELALWKSGVEVTLRMLRDKVRSGRLSACMSFVAFAEDAVECSERKGRTKANMMATVRKLRAFAPSATFSDIDHAFLSRFSAMLESEVEHTNTVAKHMRHLRTLVGDAVACGYMKAEGNPFLRYRIREVKSSRRDVRPSLLRKMCRASLSEREAHVRDAFLFCCMTGMRFSDFVRLSSGSFKTVRGKTWLFFSAVKTGADVRLPVSSLFGGKALEILSRYLSPECFARIGSNASVNKVLRGVFTVCGVKDTSGLTFHSSRHTFASLLVNAKVPITTVQRLLGHTSLRTTQGYSHVSDDALARDVGNMKWEF